MSPVATDAPLCQDCAHLQGTSQCGRPVPSYWNPATNQRRSRLSTPISAERSDRKVLGGGRLRCGPHGAFFAPRSVLADWADVPMPVEAAPYRTIGDSDGDDGA